MGHLLALVCSVERLGATKHAHRIGLDYTAAFTGVSSLLVVQRHLEGRVLPYRLDSEDTTDSHMPVSAHGTALQRWIASYVPGSRAGNLPTRSKHGILLLPYVKTQICRWVFCSGEARSRRHAPRGSAALSDHCLTEESVRCRGCRTAVAPGPPGVAEPVERGSGMWPTRLPRRCYHCANQSRSGVYHLHHR
jgi:hypothetical protein